MKFNNPCRAVYGCLFTLVLALFLAGCGGTGDSTSGGNSSPDGAASTVQVLADAGKIIGVRVNQSVTLNGSASTTTSTSPLTYAWSFSYKPDGSHAVLNGATSATPGFTADVAGTYMVQLVVTSGGISSQRAMAFVEASTSGNFTGNRVHTSFSAKCANCHDGRFALGDGPIGPVRAKSGNHPASTNMCESCHTTFGFGLVRHVDHLEVFGQCGSCHNGTLAIGKSEFHVATNAECDSCHTTDSFMTLEPDGSFNHAGITRNCASCHNGVTAIGKNEGHLAITTDCSFCHSTASFLPAGIDHTTSPDVVGKRCDSCHNNISARGQTTGHPVMAVDCGTCHSITKFSLDGVFNHRIDPTVQSCSTCHNNNNSINARGKSSAVPAHPVVSGDCSNCHATASFLPAFVDHTDSAILAARCDSCHGVSATGKPPTTALYSHMPTTADCKACHTPGTFTTGEYDHAGVTNNCATCHNNVISVGKLSNHITTTPANQDCAVCHTNTVDFAGAVFTHAGITSNCASCHNGNISTGKSNNHLVTTRDCSSCHVIKFNDFTGASFDHVGINTSNCASCHNGVIAIGKVANHIPSQVECSQCHQNTTTGGFASSSFLGTVHSGISTGCEGCHSSQFFPARPTLVKTASHLPTLQDCHVCHNKVAFIPSTFNHSGITGNCVSCHDGSANYVAVGALGKSSVQSGHPVTTRDCGVCHGVAGGSFANASFDHTGRVDNCSACHGDNGTATKKNIGHVATTQDCSVCHVPGTFKTAVFSHVGIVSNCASCHAGSGAIATVKSLNHLPTTKDCSVCHNTTAFAGARFDHTGVVNNCASCHDGVVATGKHGQHVPTGSDCSVCHLTTGFIPGTFDHVGIVGNCQSCHNATFATGKTASHVVTNQDCGVCHTTRGFIPATFDHGTVSTSTRCDSCHGVTSTGKSQNHLATSLDCRSCHTTATFVGGTWTHDASSVGVCKSCHSTTGGATPQPTQGHISTNLQCDECHNTNAWAPTTFSHNPGGNYPGDHRNKPGCSACHGSIVTTPFVYPSAQYKPFCAACHSGDFRRKDKHIGGSNGTVEQNKNCGASGCHRVTSSDF